MIIIWIKIISVQILMRRKKSAGECVGQVKREQGEYGLLIGNDPMKCVQLILLL